MSLGLRTRGTKMATVKITPTVFPRKADTSGTAVPNPKGFPDAEAKKNTAKIRGTGAATKGLTHSDKMG